MTTSVHAQSPSGGPLSRLFARIHQHQVAAGYPAPAADAQPAQVQPAQAYQYTGADPYGFTAILNRIRARAGLPPVAYDSNLSSWAHRNNLLQCFRGIGHHVNPAGVQNCAWNYGDAASVAQGWMESPGHRQNMLDPGITQVGIAFGPGPYWTLNAR
ncbi:MAG: CAP domain-containing protein [Isosphaeraceae bacterium]